VLNYNPTWCQKPDDYHVKNEIDLTTFHLLHNTKVWHLFSHSRDKACKARLASWFHVAKGKHRWKSSSVANGKLLWACKYKVSAHFPS